MRRTLLSGLVTWAALSGCATQYQPEGISGGFQEVRLDTNIFRISFRGNGFTRAESVEEMALLRAADVALANGFTHFVIFDARTRVEHGVVTTPSTSYTTGSAAVYGNRAYGSATTTTYGGQPIIIAKPSATSTIMCFNGKPSDFPGLVYDARFIFDSLGPKYKAKPR